MKSKLVTFSQAELNASGVVTKDIMIHIPAETGLIKSYPFHMYPSKMIIDNNSGSDFDFNLVFNSEEEADTLVNPTRYGQLTVRDGEKLTFDPCPRSSGIIGGGDGTASADLDIWFGGHVNYV